MHVLIMVEEVLHCLRPKIFKSVLDSHQIRNTFVTIPGGHTWHVWRRNLRDVAPLLFQK